jgi:hypothetical protein
MGELILLNIDKADFTQLYRAADRGDQDARESILPFTKLMIDHDWSDVQRIASELISRKELSYDEVVGLIQS